MSVGFSKSRFGVCAQKVGMSRLFIDKKVYAVTLLKVPENFVVEKKVYDAHVSVKLAVEVAKSVNKPQIEELKKKNLPACSLMKEFKISQEEFDALGEKIGQEWISIGDLVDIRAKNIGKGFAGGMKKWHFSGQQATHGATLSHRSIGSTGTRDKIFKQRKMPGRMGQEFVTIQNQKVLYKDEELGIIGIYGAVPGRKGTWVNIMRAIKK